MTQAAAKFWPGVRAVGAPAEPVQRLQLVTTPRRKAEPGPAAQSPTGSSYPRIRHHLFTAKEPASADAIAAAVGVDKATARRHLVRLRADGRAHVSLIDGRTLLWSFGPADGPPQQIGESDNARYTTPRECDSCMAPPGDALYELAMRLGQENPTWSPARSMQRAAVLWEKGERP